MKKKIKILGMILLLCVIAFIVVAVLGSNQAKKEKQLAEENINEEVAFEGNLSELSFSESWVGKHIIVSGQAKTVTSLYCILRSGNFEIKAYRDEIPDEISVGSTVTVDGVCTYQSSDKLRMRGCKIVGFIAQEDAVEITSPEPEEITEDTTKTQSPIPEEAEKTEGR
jgi:uncharacterized protein YpmB